MTTSVLAGLLFFFILASSTAGFWKEWNLDRNRAFWMWLVLGAVICWLLPSGWLAALLGLLLIRHMVGPQPLERIRKCDDVLLFAAGAAMLIPIATPSLVPVALLAILLTGFWSVLYALVSWWHFDPVKGYQLQVPMTKLFHFRFYEYQSHIAAGQGNPNHLHGIMVTAIAAGLGLGWIGQPIGYWLAPFMLIPMVISQFTKTDNPGHFQRPQQSWAHLLVLGLAILPLAVGPLGWLGLLSLGISTGVILVKNRHTDVGLDSGRGKLWTKMILEWWQTDWTNRLLGWGPKTFENHYIQIAVKEAQQNQQFIVAHHPHSEYVCTLVENGLLGLGCLAAYLLTTLLLLAQAGPTGQALYLVGVVLCSVAFISFPWTFYHEICFQVQNPMTPNQFASKIYTLGTPGLFAISFVILILVEGLWQ